MHSGSLFDGGDDEEIKIHPYDAVFGPKFFQKNLSKGYAQQVKITFSEFKAMQWDNHFPNIICDVILYISGY